MPEEKKYKTTKEECQERIDNRQYVCPGCGGPIIPFETVDNSGDPTFWAGCEKCSSFTDGFPPIVFKIASVMVKDHNFQPYAHHRFPYNGTDAEKDYYYTSQTRGACSDVALVLKIKQQFDNE